MTAPAPSQASDSLVKRLAGPSTTKAGLAKDQTEINRIIAEASKGSAFYENEKRKDKDLTERIERILKQTDEVMKGADLRKIEEKVDRILVEVEAQRDLSQFIVHVDMDAFYANVELLYNPSLAGKAFGVGKGVLTTASYEARKFGVRSGMPGFIAQKLCPEMIFVPLNMARYSDMSKRVMSIFRQYDPNMLAASVDEGYLNITEYCRQHGLDPEECVRQMRQRVVDETKLTVSAGIAANKMLAKICSDKNKPNGQFRLPHDQSAILDFMHDLSIRKIPGVGRVNERLLESIGIKTCGDIYTHRAILFLMDKHFGLVFMLRTYLGIASNVVQPWVREERKSIGSERTFNPIGDKEKILQKLGEVAAELEEDMETGGWTGRTVTLKYKLDTYQVFTRAKSFNKWITKKADLFATGRDLLLPEMPLRIRLIGLRVTKLKDLKKQEPATGIKRFFESTGASGSSSSVKRQKIVHHQLEDASDDELPVVQPGDGEDDEHDLVDEESMPGYHEDANEHGFESWPVDLPEVDTFLKPVPSASTSVDGSPPRIRPPRPPNSAPGPSSQPSTSANSTKPRSTIVSSDSRLNVTGDSARVSMADWQNDLAESSSGEPTGSNHAEEVLVCPICNVERFANNPALNTHIDWCLSRGAIRAAQGEAKAGNGEENSSRIVKSSRRNDDDGVAEEDRRHRPEQLEWWKSGVAVPTRNIKRRGKSLKGKT